MPTSTEAYERRIQIRTSRLAPSHTIHLAGKLQPSCFVLSHSTPSGAHWRHPGLFLGAYLQEYGD
eukprot:3585412-Rhodomonas_salina.1